MSKEKKRNIKAKMAAGALLTASMVGLAGIACGAAGTEKQEEDIVLRGEKISCRTVHTLEETAPDPFQAKAATGQPAGIYAGVPFAVLPVDMDPESQEKIFRICLERNIDFPLVMAIIEHESEFDPSARSATGDSGLMQINDINRATLYEMGYRDLFLLEDNVRAGVYILSQLFEDTPNDTVFVLMAYNAGSRGARRLRDKGIYETEYSTEILQRAGDFTDYINEALNE